MSTHNSIGSRVAVAPAIRSVLAAHRSTEAHVTEEQITAAWAEYDSLPNTPRILERRDHYRDFAQDLASALAQAVDHHYEQRLFPKNTGELLLKARRKGLLP